MNLSLPIWLATWTAGVSDQAAGALVTWLGGSQWLEISAQLDTPPGARSHYLCIYVILSVIASRAKV